METPKASVFVKHEVPDRFAAPMSQKEWMRIIHRCLVYLSENNPFASESLYKEERQVLPPSFINSRAPAQFCYPFKGIFLPSGNLDGKVWKPSQGARPTGDGLMKRYFYFKEGGTKIKRQVIWLTNNENWCFLDYRVNFKGKINVEQMQIPTGFEFYKLLNLVENIVVISSTSGDGDDATESTSDRPNQIEEEEIKESGTDVKPIIVGDDPEEIQLPEVEQLLTNSSEDSFLNIRSIFEDQPDCEPLGLDDFIRTFEEEPCNLPMQQPLIPYTKVEEPDLPYTNAQKKRKIGVEMLPIPIPIPVPVAAPVATGASFYSGMSFAFSPFDYLFNHLLSYDQILDTVCQSICTQLIFNRSYFYQSGMDPNMILTSLMQKCTLMTVDYREFPANLMSKFFRWVYECVYKVTPSKVPTVYCLICGCPDHAQHDLRTHAEFYSGLDQPLLEGWKTKATNFYDVLKELIGFLLKYPNSRQSFRSLIETYLHCPYCARKNGTHCHEKHEEWRSFYKMEKTGTAKEPVKTDNVASYTKSSFDFIMESMPFQIPSFLLSLSNLHSFLDCLVAIWRSLRLFST